MSSKTVIQETFDKVLSLKEGQKIVFTFKDEKEIESKRTTFYREKRKYLEATGNTDISISISRSGLKLILEKTDETWIKTGMIIDEKEGKIKALKLSGNNVEIPFYLEPEVNEKVFSSLEIPPNFSTTFNEFLKTRTTDDIHVIKSMISDQLSETEIYHHFGYAPINSEEKDNN